MTASPASLLQVRPVQTGWPRYRTDEIEAASAVLRSGRVNALVHGDENTAFSDEFCDYIGANSGFCVSNGTVSLELALRAFGIGPGDEVIVPARSFFATASCVLAVGALPVFADIDPHSQNISPASVRRLVGPKVRAIICVHLGGWPCDMEQINEIATEHNLLVIEDCAQAHGAEISGQKVGTFGDAGSFSFCTDKIMSTGGEGGFIAFRDRRFHDIAWSYKDHGKSLAKLSAQGDPGAFRYIHDSPGSNFRMTEMQAAIGRKQLEKLPVWLRKRHRNASILKNMLHGHNELELPMPLPSIRHAWYKFTMQLTCEDADEASEKRGRIIGQMLAMGLPAASGSCPDMSREEALQNLPIRRDGALSAAHELGKRSLMFPVDHTLSESDMEQIAEGLLIALDNV
ncbi:MAG: DegT/DnrJ/EryC1/StrS family aminotransferase [Sphingomonadaceae bacterium]